MVELSSFQLMDMKRSPQRAVVTNLAPNHLDIHKDMQEYVDAKKNIFRYQDGSGLLVLNADNDITAAFRGNGTTRFFSRKGMAYVCIEDGVICRNGEPILPAKDILIPGVHNIENYMAATAVVEGLVSDETIRHVAKTFGGVEHRIELVRVKDGVRFYNDSIASSPSRTIAGLHSFPEKVILIAGGYDKHIPYDVLGAGDLRPREKAVSRRRDRSERYGKRWNAARNMTRRPWRSWTAAALSLPSVRRPPPRSRETWC